MTTDFNERTWLAWLVKVRIIVITFLLGTGLVMVGVTRTNIDGRLFISVIALYYTISVFFVVLHYLWVDFRIQARLQVLADIAFATLLFYVSGGIDNSFHFLYPLVIITACILLPRWWAFLTASLCFIGFGAVLELSFFDVVRSFSISRPDMKSLQAIIVFNLFAYVAIAYLASTLVHKLKQQVSDTSGELENLQTRHENIVHSMRGGLITTGLDGRITLLNAPGQKLLDRRAQDVFGMMVDGLFKDPLPQVDSSSVAGEVRYELVDGAQKNLGVTVSPLKSSDRNVVGYVYTFDDLTDMRRLEREVRMRDRLSAVGRMAAGIAHEIRNPLASIAGSVQVLAGISSLNEEQRTLVNIVTRESERLNNIISDFLVYSREKNFKFAPTNLVHLLDDTCTLLKNHPQHSSAEIDIVMQFDAKEAIADLDGDRMKQVFWNLAENALKAMPNGGRLTVRVHEQEGQWCVTFADTGTGISHQQLEKIFEPFQSGFSGGTGLGLAIVYQILQAHDAKIDVKSKVGVGTEFVVRLKKSSRQRLRASDERVMVAGAGGNRA